MTEKPAFEMRSADPADGRYIRIWASGVVECSLGDTGGLAIINRIPAMLASARVAGRNDPKE